MIFLIIIKTCSFPLLYSKELYIIFKKLFYFILYLGLLILENEDFLVKGELYKLIFENETGCFLKFIGKII